MKTDTGREEPEAARPHSPEHQGAVEGDRPTDRPQHGNPNVDAHGRPISKAAIAQDVIGANVDETQG
jgi:hypothetical protein